VKDAFGMLDDGWTPRGVLEFVAGPPHNRKPVLMPAGNEGTLLGQLPVMGQPARLAHMAQLSLNDHAQPTAQNMVQTGINRLEHRSDHGLYAKMHQRFDRGDLAKSIEQERPMDTMPMTDAPSKTPRNPRAILPTPQATTPVMQNNALYTPTTGYQMKGAGKMLQDTESGQIAVPTIETTGNVAKPGKKDKPKKAIKLEREGTPGGSAIKQGPRCAKCVKSHKRCTHRLQQSPTPQLGSDGLFATPSAAVNRGPASNTPEGHTPAPPTIPDHPLAEHAAMPTPPTAEKAATLKRKR